MERVAAQCMLNTIIQTKVCHVNDGLASIDPITDSLTHRRTGFYDFYDLSNAANALGR